MKKAFYDIFVHSFLLLRHRLGAGCLLLCLVSSVVYAQSQEKVNELKREITKIEKNTNKIDLLLKLAQITPDSTLIYARQAIFLSDKLNYEYGRIKSRLIAGDYQRIKKELVSIDYLLEAHELLQEYNDTTLEAWCYKSLAGYYYHLKGILPEALKNAHKAIRLYEKMGDSENLIQSYTMCGMIYVSQNEKEDAIAIFDKAISMAEKIQDSASIAYISNCISNIYISDSQYDEALKYNQKALSIYESLGDRGPVWGVAWTYSYIGIIYNAKANQALAEGNSVAAKKLFDDALQIYKKRLEMELDIKSGSVDSYLNLANWYIQMIRLGEVPSVKDYVAIAEAYLVDCIRNAEKENVLTVLSSAYLSRSVLDSIRGDYRSAYDNFNTYIQLQDSIFQQQRSEEALRLKIQYEFDKKETTAKAEQEKKDIRQRNIRTASFATVGALLLFSLVVVRQRNKVKKEKKRSDTLLLNILPEEVADELKIKGSAEAKQFDEVSILFTDFVDFTHTSENLKPQELVQELNECFTVFDNIMEKYGLEKIKTIGDAYLAVCGLPSPDPLHAQKAVQAALEIRDFIEKRKEASPLGRFGGAFEIRIGVHSGSVVAGIVGVKKFAYDIWGDTVNTAARMEQSGKAGKVNISGVTYESVKEQFDCQYRGEIEAKNKGMMKMYFVENNDTNHNND